MEHLLVIVPCGQAKIWDRNPQFGPTPAGNAYTGAPFKVNKAYAQRFGEHWVILSAKYGFIAPSFLLPGPYNVTFKTKATAPVAVSLLRRQVKEQHLDRFATIVALGGKDYQAAIQQAFDGLSINLRFPFAGLPLGIGMQQVKRAIAAGIPFPD